MLKITCNILFLVAVLFTSIHIAMADSQVTGNGSTVIYTDGNCSAYYIKESYNPNHNPEKLHAIAYTTGDCLNACSSWSSSFHTSFPVQGSPGQIGYAAFDFRNYSQPRLPYFNRNGRCLKSDNGGRYTTNSGECSSTPFAFNLIEHVCG